MSAPARFVLALAAMLVAAGPVQASQSAPDRPAAASDAGAVDQTRVDRLTDLVIEMAPIGKILDIIAGSDPKWPMQDAPGAVTAPQLACLRGELNGDTYRRQKREEVTEYIRQYPLRIDPEIDMLGKGAARYAGQLVLAGANSELQGKQAEAVDILKVATPGEMQSFIEVVNGRDYALLREMSGLDAILEAGRARQNGKDDDAGISGLLVQLMLRAMDTCEVPLSALSP